MQTRRRDLTLRGEEAKGKRVKREKGRGTHSSGETGLFDWPKQPAMDALRPESGFSLDKSRFPNHLRLGGSHILASTQFLPRQER